MRLRLLILASVLLLSGCANSPEQESADSLVRRGCQSASDSNYSRNISLFTQAANLDEKYRELVRATVNVRESFELLDRGNLDPTFKQGLLLKIVDNNAVIASYCD